MAIDLSNDAFFNSKYFVLSTTFSLTSVRFWTTLAFVLGVMPIWLSSVEMWDGVIGSYARESNNWSIIKDWLLDSNWYITYAIFWFAESTHQLIKVPFWALLKFWITLMILGISYEVFRLAKCLFDQKEDVAAWLPAVIFSFPIWYIFFSYSSMVGHLTCVWLALIGYRFLYVKKIPAVVFGCVLITVSYQLVSNCAFLIALEMSRWLMRSNSLSCKVSRSMLVVSLAVAVFFATRVVWPPEGTYVGYNKLLNPFDVTTWLTYIQKTILWGTWFTLLLPLCLAVIWRQKFYRHYKIPGLATLTQHKTTVTGLLLLFLAVTAPYLAVGLASPLFVINAPNSSSVSAALSSSSYPISVWYGGWGARHMLLFMIVMTIMAGWIVQLSKPITYTNQNTLAKGVHQLFIILVVFNLSFLLPGHYAKLTRIAQEKTIVELLKKTPELPPGQVDFLLDKKIDFLVSSYEANFLLYRAYGGTKWFAYMFPNRPVVANWVDKNRQSILQQSDLSSGLIAGQNVMTNYDWSNPCKTSVRLVFPKLSIRDIFWNAEYFVHRLPEAAMRPISTNCKTDEPFWTASAAK